MRHTLSRKSYQCREDQAMNCQSENVRFLTQARTKIVTSVSSVSLRKAKPMGLLSRRLALLLARLAAQFHISSNRKTLSLPCKNRFRANKSIEAQAKTNGSHLSSSRKHLYLHLSNSPLPLQTRKMFHTQHTKHVQGRTQGEDRTGILAVLTSWQDSTPYVRLETP